MRHRLPPDPVEPITGRNIITAQFNRIAILDISNTRLVSLDIMQADILRLENDLAAMIKAGSDQILGHLGLAVNHHGRTTGQFFDIHMLALAINTDIDAAMNDALALHAGINADPLHQADRPHFKNTGPNAPLDIGAVLALKDNAVNSLHMQQMRKQQPRRTAADNGNRDMHDVNLT